MLDTIRLASGATEADIVSALASLSSGGTLVLPKNETIQILSGLKVDVGYRDITIDLNGSTLQQAGDITVIEATGSHAPSTAAAIGTNAAGNTVVTYQGASSLKAGDWIKVFSDDVVKGDHWDGAEGRATRMGQSIKVASVDGDTVTIEGALVNGQDYTTNIRASQLLSGNLVIKNGTVSGDQSHGDWTEPLVIVKSTVEAVIDRLTVENGSSMGIHIADSVNAEVTNSVAKNLLNNPGLGQLGYGVHSSTSIGTTVIGLYAENVRHATDNNSWDIPAGYYYAAGYGADIGFTVKGAITYDNSSYAYSTHAEAINAVMTEIMAFNSYGLVAIRGLDNTVEDAYGANLRYGIQLYEHGNDDARGNVFNNVHAQGISNTAITISNMPIGNIISNSFFESAWTSRTDYGAAATLIDTFFKRGIDLTAVKDGTAGADVILGTNGADVLSGNDGNDYIWGGTGIDLIAGGAGGDSFAYHRMTDGGDIVTDFQAGTGGDILDLAVLAKHEGWGANPFAEGHLRLVQDGENTIVEARDASGQWWQLAALLGVNAETLTRDNLVLDIAPAALNATAAATSLIIWGGTPIVDEPDTGGPVVSIPVIVDGYIRMVGSTISANSLRAGDVATMLVGGDASDFLTGGKAGDMLIGGSGADKMSGGLGDDIYQVDDLGDRVVEAFNAGYDRVEITLSAYTLGGNLEALTYIGTSNFTGTGNSADNLLTGGDGDDVFDGDRGTDMLIGGRGNDTYLLNDWMDQVTELAGQGVDTVRTTRTTYVLGDNLENLVFTGTGSFRGTGNALENQIEGGNGNDTLDGGAGADTLIGGRGNDTYIIDEADDVVGERPDEGTDTVKTALSAYIIDDNVEILLFTGTGGFAGTGNASANDLRGGAGNDILDGRAGADVMTGFAGDDTYIIDDVSDIIKEAVSQGTDTVRTTLNSYTLGNSLENLVFTGKGSFTGRGNSLANTITGGDGDDLLDGGAGADRLIGGRGNDTYVVTDRMDTIVEAADAELDTVKTSLTNYTLDANVETLIFTATGAFNGTGNGLNNTVVGGSGSDALDGGAGADTLIGGRGDDTYTVDSANDVVTELAGEGTDTVKTALNAYTLSANVEILMFTGNDNFAGTGNASVNDLRGAAGNDILDGGAGADVMTGYAGNDCYVVDNTGDVIKEAANQGIDTVRTSLKSYTLGSGLENLVFTGTGSFTGIGNSAANTITGGNGDNLIDGGAGADTLIGGRGNDTYTVTDRMDTIVEAPGAGLDTVKTTLATYTLEANVEMLVFIATGAFNGTGNALNNTIVGGSGNDILDGGVGADTMTGGSGNDTFRVDQVGDMVVEGNSSGTDWIRTTLNSLALAVNVEKLSFEGNGDFRGSGNAGANMISGGTGNDVLDGRGGADTLTGGLGNDLYVIDNIGDVVVEYSNQGVDTVMTTVARYVLGQTLEKLVFTGSTAFIGTGNSAANDLTGGNGNDTLNGLDGADRLNGGGGNDLLTGGAGNDTFVFESGFGSDRISDFQMHKGGKNGDLIHILDDGVRSFASLMRHAVQTDADVVITLDDGTLTLANIDKAKLTFDDFAFV